MRVTVISEEKVFNRAELRSEVHRRIVGDSGLSPETVAAMRGFAKCNSMNMGEVVEMALRYYFGDGADHLTCEYCGMFSGGCRFADLQPGTQTALPILDKGSVVVGLSSDEQGFLNEG